MPTNWEARWTLVSNNNIQPGIATILVMYILPWSILPTTIATKRPSRIRSECCPGVGIRLVENSIFGYTESNCWYLSDIIFNFKHPLSILFCLRWPSSQPRLWSRDHHQGQLLHFTASLITPCQPCRTVAERTKRKRAINTVVLVYDHDWIGHTFALSAYRL